MKTSMRLPLVLLISTGLLVGCQNTNKETAGTVVGAVAGGVVGAQFGHGAGSVAGAAVGALVGGLFGNAIGRSLDDQDVKEANRAFATASRAPVGRTIYWNNVRTGNWGYYRPVRDGHSRFDGYYCREFVSNAVINGRVERIYGTACRHPNGTWEAIN
jgi:surface antigen